MKIWNVFLDGSSNILTEAENFEYTYNELLRNTSDDFYRKEIAIYKILCQVEHACISGSISQAWVRRSEYPSVLTMSLTTRAPIDTGAYTGDAPFNTFNPSYGGPQTHRGYLIFNRSFLSQDYDVFHPFEINGPGQKPLFVLRDSDQLWLPIIMLNASRDAVTATIKYKIYLSFFYEEAK